MTTRLSLPEAVRTHVADGSTVYLGNFGAQLFSVGHELIRQHRRELDVVIGSGGLLLDQLLGAGLVRSATFGHCWSPIGPAPAWNFRRCTESGSSGVTLHEVSLGLLGAALTAGAHDVPFQPVTGLPGTGFADEDWTGGMLAHAESPFGPSPVVRAINPDVAFVHADTADVDGNGHLGGPIGETLLAAQASRRVVLVAEEIVDGDEVRRAGVSFPGVLVEAVVHRPGALAPDGAIGRYDRDVSAYEDYAARSRTPGGFRAWLEEVIA